MQPHASEGAGTSSGPTFDAAPQPREPSGHLPPRSGAAAWLLPTALLLLSAIPLAGGAIRLNDVASGAEITPANARFIASPIPVVVHVVSAAVYCLLAAFQFVPGFRRRRPGWHRAAGRSLVAVGLLVAASALWMTLSYPRADGTGDLLYAFRLLFASGMLVAIIAGFGAIRRGDVRAHRSWMMRAYAIGLGAGTQALTLGIGEAVVGGPPTGVGHALLMGAGWAINLAVVEAALRRRPVATGRLAGTPTTRRSPARS